MKRLKRTLAMILSAVIVLNLSGNGFVVKGANSTTTINAITPISKHGGWDCYQLDIEFANQITTANAADWGTYGVATYTSMFDNILINGKSLNTLCAENAGLSTTNGFLNGNAVRFYIFGGGGSVKLIIHNDAVTNIFGAEPYTGAKIEFKNGLTLPSGYSLTEDITYTYVDSSWVKQLSTTVNAMTAISKHDGWDCYQLDIEFSTQITAANTADWGTYGVAAYTSMFDNILINGKSLNTLCAENTGLSTTNGFLNGNAMRFYIYGGGGSVKLIIHNDAVTNIFGAEPYTGAKIQFKSGLTLPSGYSLAEDMCKEYVDGAWGEPRQTTTVNAMTAISKHEGWDCYQLDIEFSTQITTANTADWGTYGVEAYTSMFDNILINGKSLNTLCAENAGLSTTNGFLNGNAVRFYIYGGGGSVKLIIHNDAVTNIFGAEPYTGAKIEFKSGLTLPSGYSLAEDICKEYVDGAWGEPRKITAVNAITAISKHEGWDCYHLDIEFANQITSTNTEDWGTYGVEAYTSMFDNILINGKSLNTICAENTGLSTTNIFLNGNAVRFYVYGNGGSVKLIIHNDAVANIFGANPYRGTTIAFNENLTLPSGYQLSEKIEYIYTGEVWATELDEIEVIGTTTLTALSTISTHSEWDCYQIDMQFAHPITTENIMDWGSYGVYEYEKMFQNIYINGKSLSEICEENTELSANDYLAGQAVRFYIYGEGGGVKLLIHKDIAQQLLGSGTYRGTTLELKDELLLPSGYQLSEEYEYIYTGKSWETKQDGTQNIGKTTVAEVSNIVKHTEWDCYQIDVVFNHKITTENVADWASFGSYKYESLFENILINGQTLNQICEKYTELSANDYLAGDAVRIYVYGEGGAIKLLFHKDIEEKLFGEEPYRGTTLEITNKLLLPSGYQLSEKYERIYTGKTWENEKSNSNVTKGNTTVETITGITRHNEWDCYQFDLIFKDKITEENIADWANYGSYKYESIYQNICINGKTLNQICESITKLSANDYLAGDAVRIYVYGDGGAVKLLIHKDAMESIFGSEPYRGTKLEVKKGLQLPSGYVLSKEVSLLYSGVSWVSKLANTTLDAVGEIAKHTEWDCYQFDLTFAHPITEANIADWGNCNSPIYQSMFDNILINGKSLTSICNQYNNLSQNQFLEDKAARLFVFGEGGMVKVIIHKDVAQDLFGEAPYNDTSLVIKKNLVLPSGYALAEGKNYKLVEGAWFNAQGLPTSLNVEDVQWGTVRPIKVNAPELMVSAENNVSFTIYFDDDITYRYMQHLLGTMSYKLGFYDLFHYTESELYTLSKMGVFESMRNNILFNGETLGELIEKQDDYGKPVTVMVHVGQRNRLNYMTIEFWGHEDSKNKITDLDQRFVLEFKKGLKLPAGVMVDEDVMFVYNPDTMCFNIENNIEMANTSSLVKQIYYDGKIVKNGEKIITKHAFSQELISVIPESSLAEYTIEVIEKDKGIMEVHILIEAFDKSSKEEFVFTVVEDIESVSVTNSVGVVPYILVGCTAVATFVVVALVCRKRRKDKVVANNEI